MTTTTTTRLSRDLDEAMLGGVLAGIGSRYAWDPTLLRIVAALVTIATGIVPGVLLYLVAWVVIPRSDALPVPAVEPEAATAPAAEPGAEEAAAEEAPVPPTAPSVTTVADEIAETLRDAADRLGEAAAIAAEAARNAANEIGEVARRPRPVVVADTPQAEEAPSPEEPVADDSPEVVEPTDESKDTV